MSESLKVEVETPTVDASVKQIQRVSKELRELHKEMKALHSERARIQSARADLPGRSGGGSSSSSYDSPRMGGRSSFSIKEAASLARGGFNLETAVEKAAGALGEFGTPIAAAGAAIWELHKASMAAAAEMKAFRAAQLESGGTAYEVAVGGKIGRLLGLEGKDVARQARQFSSRITSDPEAASYANRYGINDQPGNMGGKVDKISGLLSWIDKLRGMSDNEATRAARATGTEDYLPLRDLTDRNYEVLKQMAKAEGAQNSPEKLIRNANDELGRHTFSEAARDIYHGMGRAFGQDVDWLNRHLVPGAGAAGEQYDRELADHQRRRQGQGMGSPLDRHTTALEQNNQHLDTLNSYLRAGLYGGGDRARGAIPGAYIGAGWQTKQLIQRSTSLGAFSL